MSAAKRRVKRKIAMLVRMDATHSLCYVRRGRSWTARAQTGEHFIGGILALRRSKWGQAHKTAVVAAITQARLRRGRSA
jgi:hypothetical protein